MSPRGTAISLAVFSGAAFLLGLLAGWAFYRCKPGPVEKPAPAVRQKDGSLILERSDTGKPADQPSAPALKPAGALPKGAVIERNIEITVQPDSPRPELKTRPASAPDLDLPRGSVTDLSGAFECPEVKVDLSLIKLKDQTQRVVASSPDGKVVGGLDVPITRQEFPKPIRWTAQAVTGYDVTKSRQVFGGQVSRNLGPFTLSGGIIGQTAFVGAGIHF